MTETPLSEVFSILLVFATKTKYGQFTIVRSLFVAAIIVVSLVNVIKDQKWATLSGVAFSLLLLTVIAMSGHQGAMGYWNFPFFFDVIHLIAISLWIGGIIFIWFILASIVKGAFVEFWRNLIFLINRFSMMATCCVFIAIITGALLSYYNVKTISVLTNTHYGAVLLMKIVLVGIIATIGAMNKFSVIPHMNNIDADRGTEGLPLGRKLLNLLTIEAGLGFLVLLLTSLLTHLSPEG
jgi:putative copper export protein